MPRPSGSSPRPAGSPWSASPPHSPARSSTGPTTMWASAISSALAAVRIWVRPDPRPSLARPEHRGDPGRDRHLRDPRRFSAARAAAGSPRRRHRPRHSVSDPQGSAQAALEAAFARAGVLLTGTLGEFLAAAETLTMSNRRAARVPPFLQLRFRRQAGRRCALKSGLALLSSARKPPGVALGLGRTPRRPDLRRHHPTRLAELAALFSSAPRSAAS